MESSSGIASLAEIHVPPYSRLLPNSCCPDKDLVVVFSTLGGKDRMSLWKMQGSKKWDVDIDLGLAVDEMIVDMTWSPDCQMIVLIHDPPRITCHSIQTGKIEREIPLADDFDPIASLTGVWWFTEEKAPTTAIPDIFKRSGVQAGTTLSLLRMLPLLDNITETARSTGMPDAFGFRTTQTKPAAEKLPDAFTSWPTLPTDQLSASIQTPKKARELQDEGLDESDDIIMDSTLVVVDDSGSMQVFLDGTYPLGLIRVDPDSSTASLVKPSGSRALLAFQSHMDVSASHSFSSLLPTEITLTLLSSRIPRDVARLSSTAHQLCMYAYRVVEDLRVVWMGVGSQSGARNPSLRWLQRLAELQPGYYGPMSMDWAKIDLLQLLAAERSTEPVSDFIGAGEQMSDRGLSKWETNVTSALIKLRDQSEQRIAPACQRLHLVLEEVLGLSQLPHAYGLFQLHTEELHECLNMVAQTITTASWLSSVARRELARFKEFMRWLRFEINNVSAQENHVLQPRHDFLEVMSYICHGLVDSPIDRWFSGEPPTTLLPMKPTDGTDLEEIMRTAHGALSDPNEIKLNRRVRPYNLNDKGRNMHDLLLGLADRCSMLFKRAANGTARSVILSTPQPTNTPAERTNLIIHEHMIVGAEQGAFTQLLAAYAPNDGLACLCILRLQYHRDAMPTLHHLVLECQHEGDIIDLLGFEFFDDESLVAVYRHRDQEQTWLGLINFTAVGQQFVATEETLEGIAREEIAWRTMQRWRSGEFASSAIRLARWRAMTACRGEDFHLAVNGRKGRRIACVLDLESNTMETLDLAADEDETEDGEEDGDGDGDENDDA
ncbi:unnamed protein product [Peniophora sp. CBMAI 1063]|nr:unnamed protein product [Peniophora sp. CBMAI 1063]